MMSYRVPWAPALNTEVSANQLPGESLRPVLRPQPQCLADALAVWRGLQAKCGFNLAAVEAVVVFKLVHHFLIFAEHRDEDAHEPQNPMGHDLKLAGLPGQLAREPREIGPGQRFLGGWQMPCLAICLG